MNIAFKDALLARLPGLGVARLPVSYAAADARFARRLDQGFATLTRLVRVEHPFFFACGGI